MHVKAKNSLKRVIIHGIAAAHNLKTQKYDHGINATVNITKSVLSLDQNPPSIELSDAVLNYKNKKDFYELKKWPIGCVLHCKNTTKSMVLVESVKNTLETIETENFRFKNFNNIDLFVILNVYGPF